MDLVGEGYSGGLCVCVCLCRQSSLIPISSDWFVREGAGGGLHVCM